MSTQETVDESVSLSDGSIHNSARAVATSQDKSRFWTATALALSIAVNVLCAWIISNDTKEQRLKQYDLDWFKSSEYAPLKSRVEMQGEILKMLQIRKECLKP